MFFGPFLPIVPLLFLLELLPESINNPIQTVILEISTAILSVFDGIFGLIAGIF